jgi:hypothetical protein
MEKDGGFFMFMFFKLQTCSRWMILCILLMYISCLNFEKCRPWREGYSQSYTVLRLTIDNGQLFLFFQFMLVVLCQNYVT